MNNIKSYKLKPKDHLGNEFNNTKEMLKHWGLDKRIFEDRLLDSRDVEFLLTGKVIGAEFVEYTYDKYRVKDHLGNKFKTCSEMIKYWGVLQSTFSARLKSNPDCTVSYLLTGIKNYNYHPATIETYELKLKAAMDYYKNKKVDNELPDYIIGYFDHLGNNFRTFKNMLAHWGILGPTFSLRYKSKNELGLEYFLTGKKLLPYSIPFEYDELRFIDHEGELFVSLKDIAKKWGVTSPTYQHKYLDKEGNFKNGTFYSQLYREEVRNRKEVSIELDLV